jgi:hypothetical protein
VLFDQGKPAIDCVQAVAVALLRLVDLFKKLVCARLIGSYGCAGNLNFGHGTAQLSKIIEGLFKALAHLRAHLLQKADR